MAKPKWRPFIRARAWARKQGIRSETQWRELKRGVLPTDIPTSPSTAYKGQWISWGDFLETGRVASQKRLYRSFQEARKWAHTQGFKSDAEWRRFAAEKRLPEDIPTNARQVYSSEWQGIADFLGNDYVAIQQRRLACPKQE